MRAMGRRWNALLGTGRKREARYRVPANGARAQHDVLAKPALRRASATRYRAMKRQAEEWIGWPATEGQHFVLPRV
jgi:hypothetical protein